MRNAGVDLLAGFGPDEPGQPVSRAKLGALASPMLRNPQDQISGDPDVHRAAIAIGHDVDPAASHVGRKEEAEPRVKPGATQIGEGEDNQAG